LKVRSEATIRWVSVIVVDDICKQHRDEFKELNG